MTRGLRILSIVAAAAALAVVIGTLLLLPAAPVSLAEDLPGLPQRPVAAGAFHVHTNRSDGTGSPDEVAAAAARAGLQFVVFADHGDGTHPSAPAYRSGVLCIDAVEISTTGGHYLALSLPRAPYPLRGEARDVVEDVARLGGFGIAAHPGSPKPALAWSDWSLQMDGIEWLNADSEWRDEPRLNMVGAMLAYPWRPAAALARILDRPEPVLAKWDETTRARKVIAVAGADAHARLGFRGEEEPGRSPVLPLPSYEAAFRLFTLRVELERPLSKLTTSAAGDAVAILDALQGGRVFTAIDALAAPPRLSFDAIGGDRVARQGQDLDATPTVTLRARTNAPAPARIVLYRNGRAIRDDVAPGLTADVGPERAAYRVEVHWPGAPGHPAVPWILSNPIYVGGPWRRAELAAPAPASTWTPVTDDPAAWRVELESRSLGSVERDPAGAGVMFHFTLAPGAREGQFAALVHDLPAGLGAHDRVAFTASATAPMRISVQLRSDARWQRSVYVNATPRPVEVLLSDTRMIAEAAREGGPTKAGRHEPLNPAAVRSLLFVVDTTNTEPSARGSLRLSNIRLGR